MNVDEMLAAARKRLDRVGATEAAEAMAEGAMLVDIRGDSQRAENGLVPGAVVIPRNVLEWRCELMAGAPRVILMCTAGYQSSLAAAVLHDLGIEQATDLDGGFEAWEAAGLPVER